MTLARCWASSLAALESALVRRIQRGAAMRAILDEGRVPTRAELLSWVVADDSMQLAFPLLVARESPDAARFRDVLDAHVDAVGALRDRIRSRVDADSNRRAHLLLSLRDTYPGARIVAFTTQAATAEAIYRALRRTAGVALLTSRGARTAGGARPRADVINALGANATRAARDEISLVVTTDLLSEGVNLQGASVIVHLDVPWTPAGLDQRVGRAARMGSPHSCVHVHGIAPPRGAEQLLTLEQRLSAKRAAHSGAVSAPHAAEELRALMRTWKIGEFVDVPNSVRVAVRPNVPNAEHPYASTSAPVVAHSAAPRPAFIAVIRAGTKESVVCGVRSSGRWTVSDSPHDLLATARGATGGTLERDPNFEPAAKAALDRWLQHRRAHESIGAGGTPSRARRALLARIDSLARRAPVHARAELAERIAIVRERILGSISAGAEFAIDELAQTHAGDLNSMLAACDARLATAADPTPRRANRPTVRALLLLQRIR
jgi:hypothetical protein